jgi:hypothetical protein
MVGKIWLILVVIDKFTKYGHFIPSSHPYIAPTMAQKFVDKVYKLHRLPSVIIYARDLVFTSKIWQVLFRLSDTKMNMSTTNHPRTDGKMEKLNPCLECCTMHASPTKWTHWLPLAEYQYNTTYHSALGMQDTVLNPI